MTARPSIEEQNRKVIAAHRAQGRLHYNGMAIALLTAPGRVSGKAFTTPVAAIHDGDRVVFAASKGGAPAHPQWYLNLAAAGRVRVEFEGESFEGAPETLPEGPERTRLIARLTESVPGMTGYDERARPHRVMPVIAVRRPQGAA